MSVSSKQIAEVLNYLSDEINKNVKTYKELEPKYQLLEEKYRRNLMNLNSKINDIHSIVLKPDLSELNYFYEGRSQEAVENVNKKLKNINKINILYVIGFFLVILGFSLTYYALGFKKTIISDYLEETKKEGKILVSKSSYDIGEDIYKWLQENPKTEAQFLKSKQGKKYEKSK